MRIPEYLSTYSIRPLEKWGSILLLHMSESPKANILSLRMSVCVRDAMKSWRLFYIFSIDKAGIETKTGIISGKFSSLPGDCKTFPTIFTQQHCMDFSLWARHLHLKMETYRKALEVISPTWKFEKPRPADSPPASLNPQLFGTPIPIMGILVKVTNLRNTF